MTILVCGSRDYADRRRLYAVLDWYKQTSPTRIIEGCARGADRLAEEWAAERNVPVEHHPADWKRLGRRAGMARNRAMLNQKPTVVIAFFADRSNPSRGTAHMVGIARAADIPVVVA